MPPPAARPANRARAVRQIMAAIRAFFKGDSQKEQNIGTFQIKNVALKHKRNTAAQVPGRIEI
jgi:hypothetical protein